QDIRMPVVKDKVSGKNSSPKFDNGRNFANKIWNASRFILGNIQENSAFSIQHSAFLEDRWILSRLNATVKAAEDAINGYHFSELASSLYQFFWTDLCDWYLEIAKGRIKSGDPTVQSILLHCLRTSLKLLHPMMPFITEEIWSKLPAESAATSGDSETKGGVQGGAMPSGAGAPLGMLITSTWPVYDAALIDPTAEAQIAVIQDVTRAIRDVRNQYSVTPSKTLDVTIKPRTAELQKTIEHSKSIIEPLANALLAQVSIDAAKPQDAAAAVLTDAEVYVAGVIDKDAEVKKLTKRREELQKFIAGSQAKLNNEAFISKAPPKVVQGLKDQLAQQQAELAAVEKNLAQLGG
ncbi:MAG: class I tRNA ligase family protein, partial [Phycisphaerae bacterium]